MRGWGWTAGKCDQNALDKILKVLRKVSLRSGISSSQADCPPSSLHSFSPYAGPGLGNAVLEEMPAEPLSGP